MATHNGMLKLVGAGIVSLLPVMGPAGTASFAVPRAAKLQPSGYAAVNENRMEPAHRCDCVRESAVRNRLATERTGNRVLIQSPNLPAGAEVVVNRFIKSQESRARGTEYAEGRKIVAGDLDNDGNPDIAVLYTLEGAHGGNDYNQYLAVFLSINGKYVYKTHGRIGGRFERNMDLKSIENGKVLFDTLEYLPKDPSCCPSKKGSTQFTLSAGQLIETKRSSSK